MSIFEEVKEFFVRNCRTRAVEAPAKDKGVVVYDQNGGERIVFHSEPRRQNLYNLASVSDFQAFVRDIPKRYPADKDMYRELSVAVDQNDTPVEVQIALPHDDPRSGAASFEFRRHEDFIRWFDGRQRSQTEFRRMLIELNDQHDQQNLAVALNFLEYKTEVSFEASAETERNYVLGYKEKEGKGGLNIPKVINVKCPVISGAAYIVEVAFDIVIRKPKQDDPRILFTLSPAGKDPVKILRDASITVAEHELLAPAIETLKANGVDVVTPIYVRSGIEATGFEPNSVFVKI